jgi:LPS-assembly lipoprotein
MRRVFATAHKRLTLLIARMVALSLTLSLTLALAACGFHLRGQYTIPDFLKEVTLRTPGDSKDFDKEMRLALERNNILPDGGEVVVEITRESLTRQTSTVDSHAKAAEYTLIYEVKYRVGLLGHKLTGPTQPLILRRSYQYSTTNVVGKSTEEDTLTRELRTDAANQIVRQLAAMKSPPVPAADDADNSTNSSTDDKSNATPATLPTVTPAP